MPLAASCRRWIPRTILASLAALLLVAALDPGTPSRGDEGPGGSGRVPWTGSRVVGSPDPPKPFRTVNAFPNLKFDHPLLIAYAPGGDRLFVGEQNGKLFSFRNRREAKAELFCDLAKEIKTLAKTPGATRFEAVYGLAFHPKFAENRYCFVCYTVQEKPGSAHLAEGSRVSRFRVTPTDPPRIDPDSEEIVFTFLQGGHNGGDLHFGPDGYLYISTGDASGPNPPDTLRAGQDVTRPLSAILRIDVDRKDPGKNYAIPKDNPFVGLMVEGKPARGEVWAYGFRNPWRMSFDRLTGELWVGDVGWETWEMVYKIEKGGNYGWSITEGRQPVLPNEKIGPTPIRPPLIEIPHTAGTSVTGGYVYRGKKFPELVGAYIFGDWETRRLWAARTEGDRLKSLVELTEPTLRIVAFGQDGDGELFIADYDAGTIHTLARNEDTSVKPADFPRTLSQTGLFRSTREHSVAPGVYPFEINARRWQDHAQAEYFVALPGTSAVTDYEAKKPIPAQVDWHSFRFHFPPNAVLVKTLSLEERRGDPSSRRRVETQLLHFDGGAWRGYSYAWRDDQSDADLVATEGAEKILSIQDPVSIGGKREQVWTFHSRAQCVLCHNAWSEYALAFNLEQLNRTRPAAGQPTNQLTWLGQQGLLKRVGRDDKPRPPYTPAEVAGLHKLTDPHRSDTPLEDRVRSYLHVNCGHCHRFGGGGLVDFELHATANLRHPRLYDAPPTRGTFDLPDPRVVAPGEPERSILYYRMAKFGRGRMPHVGSELPDERGLNLVGEWIRSLDPTRARQTPRLDLERLGPDQVGPLLQSPLTAARLARAIADAGCPGPVRERALVSAAKLPPGNVRDLFEGYLPSEGRERKLGSSARPRQILPLKGDAERGRAIYWTQAMRCQTCHVIDGKGTAIGPDLSAIGHTRTREEILESLLEPSLRIEPAYQSYLLRTVDGRAFTGLLVRRDAKEVVLRDGENKEHRVAAEDIESFRPTRESLMPTGVLADLTAQQAADLLEYLTTRRQEPAVKEKRP